MAIPPSLRQKSLQYKNGEHIASKCNNVKVCALPPIHLPLTREASVVVRGKGVLFFFNGCGNGESRCNGRGELLALQKASGDSAVLDGLVRGEEWWYDNPSGRRPNFIGRQHLTFDKGRAWMPEVERPKFCRTQNKQSVHKARVMAIFDGLCGFGGVGARQGSVKYFTAWALIIIGLSTE